MIIKNIKKSVELSKSGKPYARVVVQFNEYRDGKGNMAWVSGFGNKISWAWKVGDDVSPTVTQEGKYYNFTMDETEDDRLDVYRLPATIAFVMALFKGNAPAPKKTPQQEVDNYAGSDDEEDIRQEDIPF